MKREQTEHCVELQKLEDKVSIDKNRNKKEAITCASVNCVCSDWRNLIHIPIDIHYVRNFVNFLFSTNRTKYTYLHKLKCLFSQQPMKKKSCSKAILLKGILTDNFTTILFLLFISFHSNFRYSCCYLFYYTSVRLR